MKQSSVPKIDGSRLFVDDQLGFEHFIEIVVVVLRFKENLWKFYHNFKGHEVNYTELDFVLVCKHIDV